MLEVKDKMREYNRSGPTKQGLGHILEKKGLYSHILDKNEWRRILELFLGRTYIKHSEESLHSLET